MKINIIQIKRFTRDLSDLIAKKKISQEDYDRFELDLVKNPKSGDVISGLGGVRKIRLKSFSGGKSGGFRICYFYYQINENLFLLMVYPKNKQDDVTNEQRLFLRGLIDEIKKIKKF